MAVKKIGRTHSEDMILNANGFISAYLHQGEAEFVPLSDAPGHGYYKIPKKCLVGERHAKNLIVTEASTFMAKRMRPGTSWGAGITHLEVGEGFGSGDPQNPQGENLAQTALRDPLARKAISSWTNLDSSGNPTGSDTNVLQLSTVFEENEANGAIVEMGLFGGDASGSLGSGFMFNYKTFKVLNKDSTMQLTLVWKLTF